MKYFKSKIMSIIFGILFLLPTKNLIPLYANNLFEENSKSNIQFKNFTLYNSNSSKQSVLFASHRSHSSHSSHSSHCSHSSHSSSTTYTGTTHYTTSVNRPHNISTYNTFYSGSSPEIIIPVTNNISEKKILIKNFKNYNLPKSTNFSKSISKTLNEYTTVYDELDVEMQLESEKDTSQVKPYENMDFIISGVTIFYDNKYLVNITILNQNTGGKEEIIKSSEKYDKLVKTLCDEIKNKCK